MANYIVQTRQNLLDIALQQCGTMEAAYEMADLNGISLTDDLSVGTALMLPATDLFADASKTIQHYTANHIVPATAIDQQSIATLLDGGKGIDFWGIEYNFVVQ